MRLVFMALFLLLPSLALADAEKGSTTIDSAGNILFSVSGDDSLRLASQAQTCTEASEGAIRYKKSSGIFEGCDASHAWKPLGGSDSTPAGALMAFNLSSCPSGWSALTGIQGRAIIVAGAGSGLTPRAAGDMGGEETHKLITAEMPTHTHGLPSFIAGAIDAGSSYGGWAMAQARDNVGPLHAGYSVHSSGDGTPHNTMMPWVALLYCQKD